MIFYHTVQRFNRRSHASDEPMSPAPLSWNATATPPRWAISVHSQAGMVHTDSPSDAHSRLSTGRRRRFRHSKWMRAIRAG